MSVESQRAQRQRSSEVENDRQINAAAQPPFSAHSCSFAPPTFRFGSLADRSIDRPQPSAAAGGTCRYHTSAA